jgi:hypothetical protein
MTGTNPSLVALYKILNWKEQLNEWKQISIQLDFLNDTQRADMYKILMETATGEPRNVNPIKKFVEFHMHPPRDAPRPLNTLILQLNNVFADFSEKNTSSKLASLIINKLDQSHLQFLMNNVAPKAQVILCQQPNLRLYCETTSPAKMGTVDDLYRISVDRNYHTLAPIFHWLLEGFPGSFDPNDTDNQTIISLETASQLDQRQRQFEAECVKLQLLFEAGSVMDDNLLSFVRKYNMTH